MAKLIGAGSEKGMSTTTPPDADRLIQSVLAELGWDAEAAEIAKKVKRLDIGLPCEDEFTVICGWLGKCQLLHKLDQQQIPLSSREKFQVPDLLALFSTQATESPVLIEVKSNKAQTLSFQPGYLERLVNYADLLKFPLLIAWKHYGVWSLFETKHLKKATTNFNITLGLAMKENLLGVLAGDVAYRIGTGAGMHFSFRKEKFLRKVEKSDQHTEEWMTVIDDVAFTDFHGKQRIDLENDVIALFTAWDLELQERHTDSHIHKSFVAGSDGIEFAHRALVRLLEWESPKDRRPNWRDYLRKNRVTANIGNFSAALEAGLRQSIVYHIFHQHPHSMPEFIAARPLPSA